MLYRTVVPILIALAVAGCDMVSAVKDGMAQSDAAAAAIEQVTGIKPQVGFNYNNNSLTAVTVSFSNVPTKSVAELEPLVRAAVQRAFGKEPQNLIISFVFARAA